MCKQNGKVASFNFGAFYVFFSFSTTCFSVSIRFYVVDTLCDVYVATENLIVGEYCHAEIFRASCADDEVVMMERALYGRMSLGRCVELDMGHLGCQSDVLALADRRCSGRRSCLIRVPNAELESRQPCLRELKTYLFASYRCVQGA